MKRAKGFFTLLFFSVAVAFTGCPTPVGSILYSVDYIKAVPSKYLYGEDDWFKPAQHVQVIGVFGGVEEVIDIDKVEIIIIEDPDMNTGGVITVTNNQAGLKLEKEGNKRIVITYNKWETHYDIAVGVPGIGGGGYGDGDTTIQIIWQ